MTKSPEHRVYTLHDTCAHGHDLTRPNTRNADDSCRVCKNAQTSNRMRAQREGRRSLCGRKHNLTLPGATYPNGQCRLCKQEKARIYEARKAAAKRAGLKEPLAQGARQVGMSPAVIDRYVALMDVANGQTGAMPWERAEARQRAEKLQKMQRGCA